jgi:hypothetical protein
MRLQQTKETGEAKAKISIMAAVDYRWLKIYDILHIRDSEIRRNFSLQLPPEVEVHSTLYMNETFSVLYTKHI